MLEGRIGGYRGGAHPSSNPSGKPVRRAVCARNSRNLFFLSFSRSHLGIESRLYERLAAMFDSRENKTMMGLAFVRFDATLVLYISFYLR